MREKGAILRRTLFVRQDMIGKDWLGSLREILPEVELSKGGVREDGFGGEGRDGNEGGVHADAVGGVADGEGRDYEDRGRWWWSWGGLWSRVG